MTDYLRKWFLAGLTFLLFAQSAQGAESPFNLNGVWLAFASDPPFVRGSGTELSPQGQAKLDAYFARYGDNYVEPGAYCVPPGLPSTMTSIVGYPIEIIQSSERITILAEMEMQVRRIFLDGRTHPDNYPHSRMGHSVAHWQGDTLVVDTTLLSEYLIPTWPRTENAHIVERFKLIKRDEVQAAGSGFITTPPLNDDVLSIDITVSDPELYKGPVSVTMFYQRIADDSILEYDCAAGMWLQALEAAEQQNNN